MSQSYERGKGSWEEAAAEYRRGWLEKFGVGFFRFDTPESNRIEEPVIGRSIQNARTSFRTLLTLALRGCLEFRIIHPSDPKKEPYGIPEFHPTCAEDAAAGNQLLAEFIGEFCFDNDEYFDELMRLRRKLRELREGQIGIDSFTMKMALYSCARKLAEEKGSDPTRPEVLDALHQTTKHRPSDASSLFREAKLGFLKDGRGRPKKTRSPRRE